MKIIEYSVKNKSVIVFMSILISILGLMSYMKIGKLEDPAFKIKEAMVITMYPGATPHEVELNVTEKIENVARQVPDVTTVESVSKYGYSQVKIKLRENIKSKDIDQYWDILRKKINDTKISLPVGALPPVVLDDYGDVYGIFLAITNDGYMLSDFNTYLDYIRRELQSIQGVAKISIYGKQSESIQIVVDRDKMSNLNINDKAIRLAFANQNLHVPANISFDDKNVPIVIDREFDTIKDIENLVLLSVKKPNNKEEIVRVRDIATVTRVPNPNPTNKMKHNGVDAVGLLISPSTGTNVITTGKHIDEKIKEMRARLPVGINIEKVYYQPEQVSTAISQFVINLIESVIVVVGVLFIFLGTRSSFIIGSGLVLTILGTFITMPIFGIDIQRVSLGSFIVAMGMLVDNSIVVVDGVLSSLDAGDSIERAMIEPTAKVAFPLFGATFVAIMAFIPVVMMETYIGEYISSLFWIICVSLTLSWIFALTQIPVFCGLFLGNKSSSQHNSDINGQTNNKSKFSIYADKFYVYFESLIKNILAKRKKSLYIILGATALSILAFIFVPLTFFPQSNKSGFIVNMWLPQRTNIAKTEEISQKLEKYIQNDARVGSVTTAIGGALPRYYIATLPEMMDTSLAQLIVNTKSYKKDNDLGNDIINYVRESIPEASVSIRKYPNGISTAYPIEIQITGPDPKVLRDISRDVTDIVRQSRYTTNLTTDWKDKMPVIEGHYSQVIGKRGLVSISDIANGISREGDGERLGTLREGAESLPIMLKTHEGHTNLDIDQIGDIPVWGMTSISPHKLHEVMDNVTLIWIDGAIHRKDGMRALKVQYDIPLGTDAEVARKDIAKSIKSLELPAGYKISWEGEYYEMVKNIKTVMAGVPLELIIMFVGCVFLFKNIKEPVIIFLLLPLCFIGISFGSLITQTSFGMMSLIGVVSLVGMMIKNSIVLLDQINYEQTMLHKTPYQAVVSAATNRVRPVALAAVTTIFGMIPLIPDPLYGGMAVTIVFGLTASTILTLIVLPLFYAIAYNVTNE